MPSQLLKVSTALRTAVTTITKVTVVAPWPTAIAPKFKALGKAWEFPPTHVPTPEGWKAELTLTDLTPSLATEVPNLPPACMYVCTPQLAGGNPLVGPNSFKTLGEGPRLVPLKREFPPTHCSDPGGTEG